MRIGIVSGEYPPQQGGIGAYSQILARTLAGQGHSVRVFSRYDALEDHPAVSLTTVARRWGPLDLRALAGWAQDNRLDVINIQYQTAAFGMSPWIHFLPEFAGSVPVVTTFHDLLFPYLFPKAGPLRDWIVMRLARASAAVIATNHEDMARLGHLPHTALIPIGSNIMSGVPPDHDRQEQRMRARAATGDLLLAYFGFLNHSKGVDTLISALASLHADDIPARLVMIGGRVGSSDPTNAIYANRVDEQIERLGLASYVHWTGYVADEAVAAWLDAADVVVLPFRDGASYRRGSLMAAIQHARPIVTTLPAVDIPTFRDGENMLLVPPDQPSVLARALRRVNADAELRQHLAAGAAELRAEFDWERIARACAAHYAQVAQARREVTP
jgi:glycosyltransferase involved in cell wall biosynthesis